jgi:DNA-binding transcriptional MerR regulator
MTFSTRRAASLCHLSQRQLQYWRRTQLVTPSDQSPGGHARYTFIDLIIIRAIKQLLDAGVSVQRVRGSIIQLRRFLPSIETPLSELTLVVNGEVILVLHQGAAFEAISGQEWIFPVAKLLDDVYHLPLSEDNRQQDLFIDDSPSSTPASVAQ